MADVADELNALRAEIRRLSDRQAIHDCIHSYNRGLDRLDGDLLTAAYHADAMDEHGPFVGNAAEFVRFALEIEATFDATHHGISTQNCEIDGDVAHAESYVHFVVTHRDKDVVGLGFGRYVDQLERREGRWAIAIRRLLMDATFEVPRSRWLGDAWDAARGVRTPADLSYQRPLPAPTAA